MHARDCKDWLILNEKRDIVLALDSNILETTLVNLWESLEDKSSYKNIYLFFDASIGSQFSADEVTKNINELKKLIHITGINCPFLNVLELAMQRDFSGQSFRPILE